MGSRLRNVKKKEKLGGKGKLTEKLIKELTSYYGKAIRDNSESVEGMKKAIMSTYYHKISTDEQPQHQYCPDEDNTWCKWKQVMRKKEKDGDSEVYFTHPKPLDPNVAKHILPIYEELSRDELLERCLGGNTQNANESFNATIWRLAPKHLYSGLKTVENAAYISASIFNDGYVAILNLMSLLDIEIGRQMQQYSDSYDSHRIQRANRRSSLSTKEARKQKKELRDKEAEELEKQEGLLYAPGVAD